MRRVVVPLGCLEHRLLKRIAEARGTKVTRIVREALSEEADISRYQYRCYVPVYLDDDEYDRLVAEAEEAGVPLAVYIRVKLYAYMERLIRVEA